MCLYALDRPYNGTAVCYKVFLEVALSKDKDDTVMVTPFMSYIISEDIFNGKTPLNPKNNIFDKEDFSLCYCKPYIIKIEGGVIHAYLDKEQALHDMKTYFSSLSEIQKYYITFKNKPFECNICKIVLCECVIPEGKKYYKGDDEYWMVDKPRQCGAEQIIVGRVIAEIKNGVYNYKEQ